MPKTQNGIRITYVDDVAGLESYRPEHFSPALAADGGSLPDRIARPLGQTRTPAHDVPGAGMLVCGILFAVTACGLSSQAADARQTFEVATIKPNHSGDTYWQGAPFYGPRYSARNATLRNLIGAAYGYPEAQILGGPAWMDSDRFDIEAKVEGKPDRHDFALMVESFLEDRFQLRVHRGTRESSIYALVVARNGLKLGPHVAHADDRACLEGAPPVPGCQGFRLGPAGLNIEYTQFSTLATNLTRMLGRPVVDETGLNGRYDLKLEVTPIPDEPLANSITSALPEQIGLHLQPRKGSVEVLLVDSASKPSAN